MVLQKGELQHFCVFSVCIFLLQNPDGAGGCTHADVKVGRVGGGTYPDFELNLRRVSFRPLDEMGVFNILEGHNKGVKSPLFIFFFLVWSCIINKFLFCFIV